MDKRIQNELDVIVYEITALLPGAQVILFGSHATGNHHDDSDLDLCVIVDELNGRRMDMMHAIRGAIAPMTTHPLDILLLRRDEFQKNSTIRPTLEYAIAREGVVLNA